MGQTELYLSSLAHHVCSSGECHQRPVFPEIKEGLHINTHMHTYMTHTHAHSDDTHKAHMHTHTHSQTPTCTLRQPHSAHSGLVYMEMFLDFVVKCGLRRIRFADIYTNVHIHISMTKVSHTNNRHCILAIGCLTS